MSALGILNLALISDFHNLLIKTLDKIHYYKYVYIIYILHDSDVLGSICRALHLKVMSKIEQFFGLRRRRTGLLPSGPKSSFQMRASFVISFGNQGPRVWRKGGEAHSPSCLKSSVKFPQSVMIWGAMSSAGVGPLCFLKTNVTAPVYQEMLEHFMLLSADQLFKDADFIFQQDLAPGHTAKNTKSWLNDHGVGVLDWPGNSPDLNPIENLWGIVKRKMRNKKPKNADELKATVKETWASIPPQQCHKLITSMPRRIEAVIKAKGAPTKYWVHIQ